MRKETVKAVLGKAACMAFAVFAAFSMAACSDDDEGNGNNDGGGSGGGSDGSVFETPRYESVAAKYSITDADSPYASVELTASGNYIIMTNGDVALAPGQAATAGRLSVMSAGKGMPVTRYVHYSNILTGAFTRTGDNEYELDGFGTLTVSQSGDSSYSLDIERINGATYSLRGNKAGTPDNGSMTNNLCRTWEIVGWRAYMRLGGQTLFDFSAPTVDELNAKLEAWGKEKDPDYTEGSYGLDFSNADGPQQIVFTKSGTYMVTYADSRLAVSTWRWESQVVGRLQYSWDPSSFDASSLSGTATAYFRSGRLELTESESETDGGVTLEQGVTYTLQEVK